MKLIFNIKNIQIFKVIAMLSITFIFSCKKEDEVATRGISALAVVNAFPHDEGLNVFLNGDALNINALSYKQNTRYVNVLAAKSEISIRKDAETDALTDSVPFAKDKFYTLFVAQDTAADKLASIFVEDDLKGPTSGKAKLRFAYLTPGTDSITVSVQDDTQDTVIINRAKFLNVSNFIEVKPTPSDTTTVITINRIGRTSSFILPVKLSSNGIYTIFTYGLWNETANEKRKMGAKIITHSVNR